MSCNRDAKNCTQIAGAHGAPEAVAVWSAGRESAGHCERCGGFLDSEGVCHNPRCGVMTAILAGGSMLGVVDTEEESKGFCPHCGARLSVEAGEEDWCTECMEIVTATTPSSQPSPTVPGGMTIEDYAETARQVQHTAPGASRRAMQEKLKSIGYSKVKLALRSVGVPGVSMSKETVITNMVWQYLDRCPECKAWISPKTGICNNPRCKRQGDKVGAVRSWRPQRVRWVQRKTDVGKVLYPASKMTKKGATKSDRKKPKRKTI